MDEVLTAEMAGNVWKVEVQSGQEVEVGDVLVILESMKMEIPVESPVRGSVTALLVAPGDVVAEDQPLVRIAADPG
ncbi:biotin/lipoyl-binding carrier protein [Klenkia sp. PcliD-1-E]|uniref:biotin/lipoyl-binding carrier protein n=1 Tax=Klenkia sp. PcliD-1-E TaxID=2954492 RepID=UPI0020972BFD|nr:biotin/lipoyl-binding carrier protein [Klenkia sp. PcliD-1-E]MCO7218555.1 biotin/lipoyl-binding carrier protein [Klenkia sp. PcliD-1-E]